jgi:uncharacterized protein
MQLIDGQPVFSAMDLVGFLACEHLTALSWPRPRLVKRPVRADPELDVLQQRGLAHEQRYLAISRPRAGASRISRPTRASRIAASACAVPRPIPRPRSAAATT